LKVVSTPLPGCIVIEPKVFGDARGFFLETYNQERYAEAGLPDRFVQDNLSFSARGVLRGLHYQFPTMQGKLVSVLQGEVLDVVVDIRRGSPTFGKWHSEHLSAENKRQFYVPVGFAHGFVVVSETALFSYKCTDFYRPQEEGSILWNDPAIGIDWCITNPTLSAKDAAAPLLSEVPPARLPSLSVQAGNDFRRIGEERSGSQ
jgi:dTDP-4-dehydrorhamnose 3,5-epimerase